MSELPPLCIDLCCGLGGWAEGFLAEGYEVVGYDTEAHDYGTGGYPGKLILRDITTIHGSEFKNAAVIVGSPPCQRYSYMAMPWSRAKAQIAMIEADETGEERRKLNLLFDACFRIQREASEAAGRHIPMIVENVRGAQRWVGRAPWHYGSFYLWGDVPALMPMTEAAQKFNPDGTAHPPGPWFAIADSKERGAKTSPIPKHSREDFGWNHSEELQAQRRGGTKIPNQGLEQRHPQGISPQWRAKKYGDAVKVAGIDFNDRSSLGFNVAAAQRYREGVKFSQSGDAWFDGKPRDKMLGDKGPAAYGSRSNSRKAASAMIAKIPFPLAQHIARTFKPSPILP